MNGLRFDKKLLLFFWSAVPIDSVCTGIKHTCCTPVAEEKIQQVASLEYNEAYRNATSTFFKRSCPGVRNSSTFYG